MRQVAFDPTFDWVKGGKLPGLYGAAPNATAICTGGNHEPDCFSARLMWRNRGIGEGGSRSHPSGGVAILTLLAQCTPMCLRIRASVSRVMFCAETNMGRA